MELLRIHVKLAWFPYLLIGVVVVQALASGDPNPASLFVMAVLAFVAAPVLVGMSIRRFLPKYGRDAANWPHFFSREGWSWVSNRRSKET